MAHIMRLEYGEAKRCRWKPDIATPWDGSRVPKLFKGRRAGLVDTRLGQLDMGLEHGGGERAGATLWRALPEDMHYDVVPELGKLGIYRMGQIATRDGACLSQWKRLQVDGVIQACAGEARWYERVRRALCGETGHVLDQRWRVPSLPLRVGDFAVMTAGAGEIGRVTGILQGTDHAGHIEENGEWGPVSIELWKVTCHGNYGTSYVKRPGDPFRASQEHWAWVEGHAWSFGEHTDGYVLKKKHQCDAIRDARKEERDVDEEFSSDDNNKEDSGPTDESEEFTSYGASDGSCYPAKGDRRALTGFSAVRWAVGSRGLTRSVKRGALRNGGVYGNEANQSSTGEAAGLLEQLQMQVDDSVAHAHTQQIDCKGVLNTYAKVDDFREKDWVVQPDRREWLKIAELKRRLHARPGASFHTRWVHSHAGNWEEAVADRKAKRGAKMSYLARGMATPEGDLPWTFAWRESGTLRGGIKKALKRNAQDNHWRTIQSQTGQGMGGMEK